MQNRSNHSATVREQPIARWIARYRASGQSLRAFAKAHGLPWNRLHYWVYQKSRSAADPTGGAPVGFREVPLAELVSPPRWAAEIRLAKGITVRVSAGVSPAWVGAVVQQLSGPC